MCIRPSSSLLTTCTRECNVCIIPAHRCIPECNVMHSTGRITQLKFLVNLLLLISCCSTADTAVLQMATGKSGGDAAKPKGNKNMATPTTHSDAPGFGGAWGGAALTILLPATVYWLTFACTKVSNQKVSANAGTSV